MKVSELTSKIRDFVNDSTIKKTNIFLKKKDGDWDQFFVALDTVEDTSLAIESFKDSSDLFIKNPYLATYGILQALYIQQDAVNYLKTALLGTAKKIDWKNKRYSELTKIRQIRNETIGHPILTRQSGKKSEYASDGITSCTIDRSTLSKEGFSYLLWKHSGSVRRSINFEEIFRVQDDNLGSELEAVLKELKKEEMEHKSKFKGDKLSGLLGKSSLFEVRLIYGVQWNDHLAWPSFDHFHKLYKNIRKGLEDRYGKFGESLRVPGTELVIKKLDYVFSKLDKFKLMGGFDEHELEIYVDALDSGLAELETHLKQIDQEFEI